VDEATAGRAMSAATSIVRDCGLLAQDAIVLHNSNKLTLRILPCDLVGRVAPIGEEVAAFEVDLAVRLAQLDCPVVALEPRLPERVHQLDGFACTFWRYYPPVKSHQLAPVDFATALHRLHIGMRCAHVQAPSFLERVAEAQHHVASVDDTPALGDEDRQLLGETLRSLRHSIAERGAPEQLLHGEPHPGNVLGTQDGPVFIDLETCCYGPVEFDLAHVPEEVSARYPGADHELIDECRHLVLAMVAAWRWHRDDQFPDRERWGQMLIKLLRDGPPWVTLGDLRISS
jgi:Phosphotransferase enzyme family